MVERILCPFHNEDTPSMVVYPTSAYCFGCGKVATLQEIGQGNRLLRRKSYPKENLDLSLQRIAKLPKEQIRGFSLPTDNEGYYLVYPGQKYYTKRLHNPPKPSLKYKSPYGHSKKLYCPTNISNCNLKLTDSSLLFVVEGQMNALSLAQVTNKTVVSPGSAGDLTRPEFVNYYLRFPNICITIDKDIAGVAAAFELKKVLIKAHKKVVITALKKPEDYNYIYVNAGPEELKKQERRALELLNMSE